MFREQKVNSLTVFVDGTIQIPPLALDFDVRLVHPPADVYRPLAPVKGFFQQRAIFHDPALEESREMLGIIEPLRYNSLAHSSATRTRRSARMRVKLQLVLCSDEGQEETVTDVITLNKNNQRIEQLG